MTYPAIPRTVEMIVTHGGCHDGFAAEWLLHNRWPDAAVHQAAYNENIDRLVAAAPRNREMTDPASVLVMADFSYKLPEMVRLADAWDRIILLDHHASAIDALDGHLPPNVEAVFDVERSGAGIVADWLDVRPSRKGLVDYVEDRDLWRFALPDSKAIAARIGATPHTYADYDDLDEALRSVSGLEGEPSRRAQRVVEDGMLLLAYRDVLIAELVDAARPTKIGDIDVLAVPSPYNLGSDVAGVLAEQSPSGVGVYYRDLPGRIEFGLRSTPDGPDVAKIAEQFGGGGHPHASGFRIEVDSWAALI